MWTDLEAKLGVIQEAQTWVNVDFEMTAGAYMSLAVAFLFCYLAAKFAILFNVAFCVLICVLTVEEKITTFTNRVELSNLNIPLYLWECSFPVKRHSEASLFGVNCPL